VRQVEAVRAGREVNRDKLRRVVAVLVAVPIPQPSALHECARCEARLAAFGADAHRGAIGEQPMRLGASENVEQRKDLTTHHAVADCEYVAAGE